MERNREAQRGVGETIDSQRGGTGGRDWPGSTTDNFFFHPFFNGDFRQRSSIVTFVTTNSPFFDPLFLHVRLPALRADKHAFDIVHFPYFFHAFLSHRC